VKVLAVLIIPLALGSAVLVVSLMKRENGGGGAAPA